MDFVVFSVSPTFAKATVGNAIPSLLHSFTPSLLHSSTP
jgi:hypothetical protein